MEADEKRCLRLRSGTTSPPSVWDDDDAEFASEITIDAASVPPQVSCRTRWTPSSRRRSRGHGDAQVYIGTCTTGDSRPEDRGPDSLGGKSLELPHPRLPRVAESIGQALAEGVVAPTSGGGGDASPPRCGPCPGTHLGVPGDGENVLSTANRNFKGRRGNNKAAVYLASRPHAPQRS